MKRSRYTLETKIEAVSYVLKENHSKREAAREFKIDRNMIRQWVSAYEHHGIEGLTSKNKFYSGYFKENVVKYMLENDLSAYKTAAEFNIPFSSTVSKWRRIYFAQGEYALKKGEKDKSISINKIDRENLKIGKDEKKELLAEIKRLKMENDYLKKLNALIQEKEKSMK
jgi:transposase